jgi:WD40 repeat protein
MPAHRQVVLLAALLTTVVASANGAGYTPVPLIEVGKPKLEDIAYSPDGSLLATLTTDWVELLDADTYEPVARFGSGGHEVQYSQDGSEVAVFRYDLPCRIYDAVTGAVKEELPVTGRAYAFSPDWSRLAYADHETVYVWDRAAGAVTATLSGDPEPTLASAYGNNPPHRLGVMILAFHADGVRLLVASPRATLAFWNVDSGELLRHYDIGTWVWRMAVQRTAGEFAVITGGGVLLVRRFDDLDPRRVSLPADINRTGPLEYSATGEHLWLTGERGPLYRVDRDGQVLQTDWPHQGREGYAPWVGSLAVDSERGVVACVAADSIGVWPVATMRLTHLEDQAWGAGTRVGYAAYIPQYGSIVTLGATTRRWRIDMPAEFSVQTLPVAHNRVDITPDGETAVMWFDELREAVVFEIRTGETQATIPVFGGGPLAISPSGRLLAWEDFGRTEIWDVERVQRVARLDRGSSRPRGYGFTPSEKRLVIRTVESVQNQDIEDGELMRARLEALDIWDIEDGELVMTEPAGGPFAATARGVIYIVWERVSPTDSRFDVRRVGTDVPLSAIGPVQLPHRGTIDSFVEIDPSGRYVAIRGVDPTTDEAILRYFATDTGDLLATRPYWPRVQFTAGGDYLFAKGPNGGRALYHTDDYLNIPSHDLTPRNKLLAGWGDVKRTQLLPNYPNPFNPETWIPFDLAEAGPVEVVVYDDIGRVVRRVDLGQLPAGAYRTRERAAYWDGRNDAGESVASGAYFIELHAGSHRQTRRTTLAK